MQLFAIRFRDVVLALAVLGIEQIGADSAEIIFTSVRGEKSPCAEKSKLCLAIVLGDKKFRCPTPNELYGFLEAHPEKKDAFKRLTTIANPESYLIAEALKEAGGRNKVLVITADNPSEENALNQFVSQPSNPQKRADQTGK